MYYVEGISIFSVNKKSQVMTKDPFLGLSVHPHGTFRIQENEIIPNVD